MATNCRVKIGEIGQVTFIGRVGNFDFKKMKSDDLTTARKNLVNFCPVTSEFKRVKSAYCVVDQQFSYVGWRRH